MKNWRAAVTGWVARLTEYKQTTQNNGKTNSTRGKPPIDWDSVAEAHAKVFGNHTNPNAGSHEAS
jgi:hypothetical protein